jgi:hypothetical protein
MAGGIPPLRLADMNTSASSQAHAAAPAPAAAALTSKAMDTYDVRDQVARSPIKEQHKVVHNITDSSKLEHLKSPGKSIKFVYSSTKVRKNRREKQ